MGQWLTVLAALTLKDVGRIKTLILTRVVDKSKSQGREVCPSTRNGKVSFSPSPEKNMNFPFKVVFWRILSALNVYIFTASRNARIASAVLATAIPSVCPSVRQTPVLCKTTARSTVQFALLDSKMCLVL